MVPLTWDNIKLGMCVKFIPDGFGHVWTTCTMVVTGKCNGTLYLTVIKAGNFVKLGHEISFSNYSQGAQNLYDVNARTSNYTRPMVSFKWLKEKV